MAGVEHGDLYFQEQYGIRLSGMRHAESVHRITQRKSFRKYSVIPCSDSYDFHFAFSRGTPYFQIQAGRNDFENFIYIYHEHNRSFLHIQIHN
jgi:hypothetical protein